MNKALILSIFSFFFIIIAKGQAHLGVTEYSIRNIYPEKKWTISYTTNGIKYISADMIYGTFIYYFDKETSFQIIVFKFLSIYQH